MSQIAPNSYNPNYSAVLPTKGVAISREARFKAPRANDQLDLNPNYEVVRSRPPVA